MGRPSGSVVRGDACAPQRSLFYVPGLTEGELDQSLIGVVSAYSEIVPGHLHLDKITEAIKAGVRMAGGTLIMVPSIGVCDGIAIGHIGMRYPLTSRELITDNVETMTKTRDFDSLVLVPNCDRIVPGMLMGALHINVPSIVMNDGAMLPGNDRGKAMSLSTMFEAVGVKKVSLIDRAELTRIGRNACPGRGPCSGMFTASSMNCLCEMLGIALPDNGTIPTVYSARTQPAKKTGVTVMDTVGRNIRLRDIVNKKSLRSGLTCDMALDCSSSTVLHLLAIAKGVKVEFDLDMINEASQKTPNLYKLAPAGPDHIVDLYNADGVQAVTKELSRRQLIDTDLMTVTGKTAAEDIATAVNMDTNIIKGIEHPNSTTGGVAVLFRNIAPKGCVVKRSAMDPKMMTHTGSARVFDSEEAATEVIYAGSIVKEDVVVICYEGPKDGPDTRGMLNPTSALAGMQLDKDVVLITSGHFSGTTHDAAIGHVSPGAAAQGPVAIIQEGDSITIDIPNDSISLNVDVAEIKQRLQTWEKQEPKVKEGRLHRYSRLAASTDEGAALK